MRFVNEVIEQLNRMSEKEKEDWIISQARLVEEKSQQDFLMSLSGEKKIMYMPGQKDIEEFCEKVEKGYIYLEYVAHYYEFDDDGRYMDEWQVWFNDPSGVMPFLNKVLRGCHDLLILNENKAVADILDRVCRLEFRVEEAEESEDMDYEGSFTIEDAIREGKMPMDIRDVGTDWVTSVVRLTDRWDGKELAKILVRLFEQPVCGKINPSVLNKEVIPEDLFSHMLTILDAEILNEEIMCSKMFPDEGDSAEKVQFERKLKKKQEMAEDIRANCLAAVHGDAAR